MYHAPFSTEKTVRDMEESVREYVVTKPVNGEKHKQRLREKQMPSKKEQRREMKTKTDK